MPRHTAHFRRKLGRARRERDLPQPAPELIVDWVRAESFFLPFENYGRDLYPPWAPFGGFTSGDARNEQHRNSKMFFPAEEEEVCHKFLHEVMRNRSQKFYFHSRSFVENEAIFID